MNKIEALIFDLDGTLWSTIDSCLKVLNELRLKYPEITRKITREQVEQSMGKHFDQIVDIYFGYLDKERAEKIAKEGFQANIDNLIQNGGILYPSLEETIKGLSQKYKLFIVSNCVDGYIESFLDTSGLKEYFTDHECIGRTGLSKGENIKLIMQRNNIQNAVYVGDTMSDKEAADYANIPFVYASYGFGDVDSYDYKIDSVDNLLTLFNRGN